MSKEILTVRIEKELKEKFIETCKDQESDASKEIRKFIKQFIAQHGQGKLL